MSTLKYTPGPWEQRITKIYGKNGSVVLEGLSLFNDEKEANNKLIAAAPELLEVCIRAKDYLHTKYPKEADIFNELDKVITKATQ